MPQLSDTLKLGWYMREGLGALVADTAADLPANVVLLAVCRVNVVVSEVARMLVYAADSPERVLSALVRRSRF